MKRVRTQLVIDDEVIDEGDAWKVIQPVWWTANIYDGVSHYEDSLQAFSREQRFLLAVFWYEAEVNNGGHDQFYFNSTGIVWKDALLGLKEMDLDTVAEILAESADRMGGSPPLARDERQEVLDRLQPEFGDLDKRFYAAMAESDVNVKLAKFVSDRRTRFYFDGYVDMTVR